MNLFKKAQPLLIIAAAWLLATVAMSEDQLFGQPGLSMLVSTAENESTWSSSSICRIWRRSWHGVAGARLLG